MPANNKILICAVLTTGLLLQGSSCFGDDRTKLSSTWKLVAFMTEDINNKVRENVCEEQAEGYLTFTDAVLVPIYLGLCQRVETRSNIRAIWPCIMAYSVPELAQLGRGWTKTQPPIQLELADSYANSPRYIYARAASSSWPISCAVVSHIGNMAERTQFQLFVVRHMLSRIRAAQRSRSARLRLENARRS